MAVVKADGFGHGAGLVAGAALANGATWLGVTSLAEATAIRRSQRTASASEETAFGRPCLLPDSPLRKPPLPVGFAIELIPNLFAS